MLTKLEKELNTLMRKRGVDLHTRMGIMYTLKTEENFKLLMQWITDNLQAGQYEIMGQWDKMYKKPPQKSAKTRKAYKVAMF